MIVAVPDAPLYVGTSRDLICTIALVPPELVDTSVRVEVNWTGPAVSSDRFKQSNTSEIVPGTRVFEATLTLTPLAISDTGDYICTATVVSTERGVSMSSAKMGTGNIAMIEGMYCTLLLHTTTRTFTSAMSLFLCSSLCSYCHSQH